MLNLLRAILAILAVSLPAIRADGNGELPSRDSAPKDDVFVRVYFTKGVTNVFADEKLLVAFMSKTNGHSTILFPKQEYMCRMTLVDDKQQNIPKTRLGARFGDRFSELRGFSLDVIGRHGYNTGGSPRPDSGHIALNDGTARDLPPVSDLFKLKNPGTYTLSLEFQIFKTIQTSALTHTNVLVRLPPVQIPVEKWAE